MNQCNAMMIMQLYFHGYVWGKGMTSGLNSSASMLVEVGGGVAAGEKIKKVDLEEKCKKGKRTKKNKIASKTG